MSDPQAASQPDLGAIWHQVTETLKQRVVMPALWRAMENGAPIALEDSTFVVGYEVQSAYDSHLLMDSRYRNLIEQSLESGSSRQLRIWVDVVNRPGQKQTRLIPGSIATVVLPPANP